MRRSGLLAQPRRLGKRRAVAAPDPGGPPELDTGTNTFDNSKLLGSSPTTALDWEPDPSNSGNIEYLEKADGTRALRCEENGGSGRANIQQVLAVTEGQVYTFSLFVDAVDDVSDSLRAVTVSVNGTGSVEWLNEAPRITVGALVVGQRVFGKFVATVTGNVTLRIGLGVGQGQRADVTVSQPQIDPHDGLRTYIATDPVATEPEPPPAPAALLRRYYGQYLGFVESPATGNNVVGPGRGNSGAGIWFQAPRSGDLRRCGIQITTRKAGEETKSRKNGSLAHPLENSWLCRAVLYPSNASRAITGSAIYSFDFVRQSSSEGSNYEDSRINCPFDLTGVSITGGAYYAFLIENRESDPSNNHVTLNMFQNVTRPAITNPFLGANMIPVTRSSNSLSSRPNAMLSGFVIEYSDLSQYGSLAFDATYSALGNSIDIGGSSQVRQTVTPQMNCTVDQVGLATMYNSATAPESGLTVNVNGPSINATTVIAKAAIPAYIRGATSPDFGMTFFNLSAPLSLVAGSQYNIVVSSPGSTAGRWKMNAGRRSTTFKLADGRVMDPAPASWLRDPFSQHDGEGTARFSTDGGSTWQIGGMYSSPNWPIALRVVP